MVSPASIYSFEKFTWREEENPERAAIDIDDKGNRVSFMILSELKKLFKRKT